MVDRHSRCMNMNVNGYITPTPRCRLISLQLSTLLHVIMISVGSIEKCLVSQLEVISFIEDNYVSNSKDEIILTEVVLISVTFVLAIIANYFFTLAKITLFDAH